jgi:UDP-N-acetylglucosamine pyrophosphorylase
MTRLKKHEWMAKVDHSVRFYTNDKDNFNLTSITEADQDHLIKHLNSMSSAHRGFFKRPKHWYHGPLWSIRRYLSNEEYRKLYDRA